MVKVRINNGRAVHNGYTSVIKGKESISVSCGAARVTNAPRSIFRPAASNEEVTCKKCLAAMEKEQQEQQPEKELSLKDFVGQSISVPKADMKPSYSRSGQNKKLTTAQKRKYGII